MRHPVFINIKLRHLNGELRHSNACHSVLIQLTTVNCYNSWLSKHNSSPLLSPALDFLFVINQCTSVHKINSRLQPTAHSTIVHSCLVSSVWFMFWVGSEPRATHGCCKVVSRMWVVPPLYNCLWCREHQRKRMCSIYVIGAKRRRGDSWEMWITNKTRIEHHTSYICLHISILCMLLHFKTFTSVLL